MSGGWKATLALGAAVAVGGYYTYTHTRKPTHQEYDLTVLISGSPEDRDWEVISTKSLDSPALIISVTGGFKVGKTHLVNHLCLANLPDSEADRTYGLSFLAPKNGKASIAFIDTAGTGRPIAPNENLQERKQTDQFLTWLAFEMANVRVVVVSNCSAEEQQQINEMRDKISEQAHHSKDLLIVVHNFHRVEDPAVFKKCFENDVQKIFEAVLVESPYRSNDKCMNKLYRSGKIDASGQFTGVPVIHLPLAKENSVAGKQINPLTYETLYNICSSKAYYASTPNFISKIVSLSNGGLLKQYLHCDVPVKFDTAIQRIVADHPTHLPPGSSVQQGEGDNTGIPTPLEPVQQQQQTPTSAVPPTSGGAQQPNYYQQPQHDTQQFGNSQANNFYTFGSQ